MSVTLKIKRLDPELPLPIYAKQGDAGLDLQAVRDATIDPGCRELIGTGIAVAIPHGYAGYVQPRSGLAINKGMTIVNTPGLIDSGYRGEIGIIAYNTDSTEPIHIKRGDKIAQLVILEVPHVEIVEAAELDETERGATGFGSSGI